jgi:hypothetical protein
MCYRLQLAGIAGIILRNCPMQEFIGQIIQALYYYTGWMGKADGLEKSEAVHLSRRERELVSLARSPTSNRRAPAIGRFIGVESMYKYCGSTAEISLDIAIGVQPAETGEHPA